MMMTRHFHAFTSKRTWTQVGRIIGAVLLLYLFGPAMVRTLKPLPSNKPRPWVATSEGAWVLLAWYLPGWLFFSSLSSTWLSLFTVLASLVHLPWLAFFGDTSFWPLTLSNLLWRWLVVLPAMGMVACFSHPVAHQSHAAPFSSPAQLREEPRRVLTSEEAQQLAALRAAEEKKQLQAEQRRLRRAITAATPQAPSRSRQKKSATSTAPQASSVPSTPDAHLAPAGSLWDTVDWTQVPDDHPAKVAALQEAQRNQWLTQQAHQQGILSTPSTPSAAPAPQRSDEDQEDYDWSQGQGTVQKS